MTRWEYLTMRFKPHGWFGGKTDPEQLQHHLNELGDEGWEVTGVIETNSSHGDTREVVILMKRPKL
ncbi:MAG TPA: DUF4177 domain-containing protein [Luteolibacter sp.]|nr:DUF4177 domain-containing protein [Luteolibacter sp.]